MVAPALRHYFSNIWSTGTIRTEIFLSGKTAICLSSARTSSGVPSVSYANSVGLSEDE